MANSQKNIPSINTGFALVPNEDEEALFADRLELVDKEIPQLKKGQVLVKILAAPVNPSDLVYLMGKYGVPPVAGAYAGFEACGIVVKANASLYGRWLVGKRVAVFATPGSDGVWAKYAITGTQYCLPVRKELSDEQASTLVVNPCTSVCLVERALELGAKAVIINAAASQVGKGIIRYAKLKGMKTIATVRSQANVDVLTQLGADEVLLTSDEFFKDKLKQYSKQMGATVLLDSVADLDTPTVLQSMPNRSTAIVYGRLTETHDPIGGLFSVSDVIFRDIKIEGFWLADYVRKAGPLKVILLSRKVQKLFADGIFDTDIYGRFGFDDFVSAIEHYAQHKSDGKVIFQANK